MRWNAVGHGTFFDPWNFDWKASGGRSVVAEGATRTLSVLLAGGKSFNVTSVPILFHQAESSDAEDQGPGPARF